MVHDGLKRSEKKQGHSNRTRKGLRHDRQERAGSGSLFREGEAGEISLAENEKRSGGKGGGAEA